MHQPTVIPGTERRSRHRGLAVGRQKCAHPRADGTMKVRPAMLRHPGGVPDRRARPGSRSGRTSRGWRPYAGTQRSATHLRGGRSVVGALFASVNALAEVNVSVDCAPAMSFLFAVAIVRTERRLAHAIDGVPASPHRDTAFLSGVGRAPSTWPLAPAHRGG